MRVAGAVLVLGALGVCAWLLWDGVGTDAGTGSGTESGSTSGTGTETESETGPLLTGSGTRAEPGDSAAADSAEGEAEKGLHGRVVWEGGRPRGVAHVRVARILETTGQPVGAWHGAVDAESRFAFPHLDEGLYRVSVLHAFGRIWEGEIEVEAPNAEVELEARQLRAGPGVYEVHVTDSQGHAPAKGRVCVYQIHSGMGSASSQTGSCYDGLIVSRFNVGRSEGVQFYIHAVADTERGKEAAVAGPFTSDSHIFRIQLEPALTIAGTLSDGGAAAIADCPVHVKSHATPDSFSGITLQDVTDADGRFEIDGLVAGPCIVTLGDHPERVYKFAHEAVAGDVGLDLRITRGVRPTIRVLDPDGEVVPQPDVYFERPDVDGPLAGEGRPLDETTDGERIDEVPGSVLPRLALDPRVAHRFTVHGGDDEGFLGVVREGWIPQDETVRLTRGMTVTGQVLDARGDPVEHVWIEHEYLDGEGEDALSSVSMDGSRFEIIGLRPGRLRLRAKPRTALGANPVDDDAWREVEAGARDVRLVLPARNALRIRFDMDVEVPAWLPVKFTVSWQEGDSWRRWERSLGGAASLVLYNVEPDRTYNLHLGSPMRQLGGILEAVRGDAGEVTMQIVATEELTGTARAIDGEAFETSIAVLLEASGVVEKMVADSAGKFRILKLIPGVEYELRGIALRDGVRWEGRLPVSAGDGAEVELILYPPN